MIIREQGDEEPFDELLLADDDLGQLLPDPVQKVVLGDNAFGYCSDVC